MRYTESKLTKFANLLISELKSGTVDWQPNFDGSLLEPVTLDSIIDDAKKLGITVIGSLHDFEATPELAFLTEKIDPKADLHKFALMAQSPNDIRKHLDIFEGLSGRALSVMGMGPLGAAARPLMAEAGSLLRPPFLNEWSLVIHGSIGEHQG